MTSSSNWQWRASGAIVAWRKQILAAVAVVTILAGLSASTVRFDNSIEIWFLEGDPSITTYQAYLDRFEADEVAILALFADDVFSPDSVAALDRMTRAAEAAPHVHRVLSITNVEVYESRDDAVQLTPLVEPLPTTTSASARIRAHTLEQCLDEEGSRVETLECACGARYRPTAGGLFAASGSDEERTLSELAEPVWRAREEGALFVEVSASVERDVQGPIRPLTPVAEGRLEVGPEGVRLGDIHIPLSEITSTSTERADTLQVGQRTCMWQFRLQGGSAFRLQRALDRWRD